MESEKNETAEELRKKIFITYKIRHSASSRLALHSWASQWTLALLAVGQVIIGLAVSLDVRTNFHTPYVSFAAIFFSVLVLTYSLLLGMSNFPVRKERFHDCALKLEKLYLFVSDYITDKKINKNLEDLIHKYNRILAISENHTRGDYLRYRIEDQPKGWKLKLRFEFYLSRLLQFGHYLVSISLMYVWIYFFLWPKN